MDHIRIPAGRTQFVCETIELGVGSDVVFADWKSVYLSPEQLIEQNIARLSIGDAHVVHAFFELNVTRHTELRRCRSRHAHVVRLHSASDQHGVCALRKRITKVEFELACLVATHCQTGAVISFH